MMGSQIISNLGHTQKDAGNAVRKAFLSWVIKMEMRLNIQALAFKALSSHGNVFLLFFPQHYIY